MAINLNKGQKVDLTKKNPGLSFITVGLGWDAAETEKKGFFSSIFRNIDCDASVILLDKNEKKVETICFSHLRNSNRSIIHTGDNLTGDGDGDDEQIRVDLKKVPSNIEKLVFIVNIFSARRKKQHFGMIKNAFIRLVDESTNKEILRYSLTDDYSNKTALFVSEIYREQEEWKFLATGEGTTDNSIREMEKRYR